MPWENHYPADASQMDDHIKTKVLWHERPLKMLIVSKESPGLSQTKLLKQLRNTWGGSDAAADMKRKTLRLWSLREMCLANELNWERRVKWSTEGSVLRLTMTQIQEYTLE